MFNSSPTEYTIVDSWILFKDDSKRFNRKYKVDLSKDKLKM